MRNADEVLTLLKSWGVANQQVRALILTGSRASKGGSTDVFSDYDIEVTVLNREVFLEGLNWLQTFGEPLASVGEDNSDFSMRLILFKDYVRIDFKIYEPVYVRKYGDDGVLPPHYDNGYRVLLDKDNITAAFPPASYTAYNIKQPTAEEFVLTVNDFWWDTTYVAKSLWRNEIFYAKYMLDSVIRFSYLQKMIEWNIGIEHHWQVTTNKQGRFFKQYLPAATWAKLQTTYAGSAIDDNWNALYHTIQFFRELAVKIAGLLNYTYPQTTDTDISRYLEKIRLLDHDAVDIR